MRRLRPRGRTLSKLATSIVDSIFADLIFLNSHDDAMSGADR